MRIGHWWLATTRATSAVCAIACSVSSGHEARKFS
jgi:hypothetical protein